MKFRPMTLAAICFAVGLSACGQERDPRLLNVKSNTEGPDEFGIIPNKPLVLPEDVSALPAPAPGGKNRTEATPQEDAIVALGGWRLGRLYLALRRRAVDPVATCGRRSGVSAQE